ncbi:MAG TPA: prolyl-tRNA synthetase associated domain-containing protein [Bacilli bacterium]|nr:prolyl-tRNA synthetase associated domain-containing protein [Bacilli bacterium]
MNKYEIYEYLKQNNIWHEIEKHKAVYNMEGLSQDEIAYPGYNAKNLFVRDDKKRNYYLITVKCNKTKVDLKKFSNTNVTGRLSFASENDLKGIMDLIPGSVTPLGLLNDKEHKVKFYIDKDFMNDKRIIGIHPNDNTETVWLKIEDLINIIKEYGNDVFIVEI